MCGALLEVEMFKKCTPLWHEAHFEVKRVKKRAVSEHILRVSHGRRNGFCVSPKVSQKCGFLQRSTRDMFIRDVRKSGRWFPEKCCMLEHQIFRFAKMIFGDRCSTSDDLASRCRGRRSSLDRWNGKIAKRIGTRPSALHSTFHLEEAPRRIASYMMLSTLSLSLPLFKIDSGTARDR